MLVLSKLSDAVSKVASVAAEALAARTAIAQAQSEIDALTASLIAAVGTPAEAAGIAAVADALFVAPAPVDVPSESAVAPALPLGPAVPVATFLPGDPRAPKA
jgi:hypothetical protein